MVGAILTQNTNWRNVSAAIEKVKRAGLMDPIGLRKHARRIPALIRSSGFYRSKARCLRAFLEYYVTRYDGRSEAFSGKRTSTIRKELLAIPGIGPETADSILLYALGRRVFVVDAYTRRIFSRHGLVEYDHPYDTLKRKIENGIPASVRLYNEYHALLVRTGKEYCKKNDPLCDTCPLCTVSAGA